MQVVDGPRYSISNSHHRNSWWGLSLLGAVVSLASGVACGTRAVKPPSAVDGGSGGLAGSGGAVGSGGNAGGSVGTGGSNTGGGSGSGDGGSVGTGGTSSPDGATDGTIDGAALCSSISTEYAAAVHAAQECNVGDVGTAHQCEIQVRASFFCNCTTFVNSGADGLAAIVTRYDSNGCQRVCIGTCTQPQTLTCLSDATSSTGGRCKVPGQLALTAENNGGNFSVDVGNEVDITLESTAPGSYSTDIAMSSDLMTVLEITIPSSAPNPNGPTRLYRLRALSAGQVEIQIPFESALPSAPHPSYRLTITVR